MPFHKDITIGDRHAAHNFEFANDAARLGATGLTPADIGKIALQLDNKLLYSLVNDSPATWFLLTADAQTASDIEFTPDGDIAATDVQAAIVEVRDDTDTKLAGKADTDDSRLPTQDENDALAGTGVPAAGDPYVSDSDSRNTNARTPTGTAAGDLAGTYPNPGIAAGAIVDADVNAAAAIVESKLALNNPTHAEDHKTRHVSGGADAFVAADTLEAASRTVREPLRNETGGEIPKGTLVAVSGFSVPAGRPLVVIADKDDSAKRPALAVTEAAVPNNTNFEGLVLGLLTGLNTSAFSANDQLALGDAGAVSRPPPDTDPFTGEIQLVGSVVRSDASNGSIYFTLSSGLLPMTAAQFFLTKETGPTGSVSGGEVTRATGPNVDVASGTGFVNDDTDVFRVTWSAVTDLALTASDTNFIFVDKNGVVTASTTPPSLGDNVVLADAITDTSGIVLLSNHQVLLKERPQKSHDYAKDVVGNVVVSGLATTKDAIAFRLQVDTGTFYTRDFRVTVPATDPITFIYWLRDGAGGFKQVAGAQTLIDKDNFDDGSGTLAALLTTEFKKDLLFVVFTGTGLVEYHVFYGQEKFTSQSEAEAGNLPSADSDVIANGVRSGGVVIEGAAAAIASVVDVRPFVGQLAPGTTAVTDHGLLSGLADDDHSQYLLGDGTRAMSGSLDMGANAIANVGNVDGVDVSAHKDRHKSGGADPFAAADLLEAVVKRIRTTTGPTDLLVGDWADGDVLQRVGSTAVGSKIKIFVATVGASGDFSTIELAIVAFEATNARQAIFHLLDAAYTLTGDVTLTKNAIFLGAGASGGFPQAQTEVDLAAFDINLNSPGSRGLWKFINCKVTASDVLGSVLLRDQSGTLEFMRGNLNVVVDGGRIVLFVGEGNAGNRQNRALVKFVDSEFNTAFANNQIILTATADDDAQPRIECVGCSEGSVVAGSELFRYNGVAGTYTLEVSLTGGTELPTLEIVGVNVPITVWVDATSIIDSANIFGSPVTLKGDLSVKNTLTTTDGVFTTIATIPITDDTVNLISAMLVGRRTDAADRIGVRIEAVVFREAAGSATLQGAENVAFTRSSDNQYGVQIIVSGNNALVQVKGDIGHTLNWESVHEVESVA